MKKKTVYSSIITLFSIIMLIGMVGLSFAAVPDPDPTDLGMPAGCNWNVPMDINSSGQIVGEAYNGNNISIAYIWENGKGITQLPSPDPAATSIVPMSINDNVVINAA